MSAYIQWLAGNFELKRAALEARVLQLRRDALTNPAHARTPEIVANLQAGFEMFLMFAVAVGALSGEEQSRLKAACWEALRQAAAAQAKYQETSEPTAVFLMSLRTVLSSGRAHLKSRDGKMQESANRFGWGTRGGELIPLGDCVGWLDGDDIYIDSTAAYRQVQLLGRDTGESIPVTEQTLRRRLREKGLLASVDTAHQTITVRRTIEGTQKDVLHFLRSVIFPKASGTESQDES
jgi:hypothetical protein